MPHAPHLPPLRRVKAACARAAVFLPALVPALGCKEAPSAAEPPEAVGAGQASPVIGAEEKIHSPGELGTARDFTMSVESVRACSMTGPFAPGPGRKALGIEVVIEGTSDRDVPANPFYATLESRSGDTFDATLAGCEPVLRAQTVTRGKQARGIITFEIPQAARKLELRYAPAIIGGGRQVLRFRIED